MGCCCKAVQHVAVGAEQYACGQVMLSTARGAVDAEQYNMGARAHIQTFWCTPIRSCGMVATMSPAEEQSTSGNKARLKAPYKSSQSLLQRQLNRDLNVWTGRYTNAILLRISPLLPQYFDGTGTQNQAVTRP